MIPKGLTFLSYGEIMGCSSSPVAQLVEQVAVNHRVGGSNPSRGAILSPYATGSRALVQLASQPAENSVLLLK